MQWIPSVICLVEHLKLLHCEKHINEKKNSLENSRSVAPTQT